jgi:hypothetical protein
VRLVQARSAGALVRDHHRHGVARAGGVTGALHLHTYTQPKCHETTRYTLVLATYISMHTIICSKYLVARATSHARLVQGRAAGGDHR